jgi:L(+)-tartrate dehydratase alpha subunit
MTMISNQAVEQAAYDIMAKAAIDIPDDYVGGIKKMIGTEKVQLSCFVLQSMVENWEAAT